MKYQLEGQLNMFSVAAPVRTSQVKPLKKPMEQHRKNQYKIYTEYGTYTVSAYTEQQAKFLFHKFNGSQFIEDIERI